MKGKNEAIISFRIIGASPEYGWGFGIEKKHKYKIITTVGTPNIILLMLESFVSLNFKEIS